MRLTRPDRRASMAPMGVPLLASLALWLAAFQPACGDPGVATRHDAAPVADALADDSPPTAPTDLVRYLSGKAEDSILVPQGPALFLAGGGSDQASGFAWAQSLAPQGDVVILRSSGADGYNDYLYDEIGGFDSVETLLVDRRELADSDYVFWALQHAELIFMAGGDQWSYLDNWRDTKTQEALQAAWQRGAIIGGTSAGCAILGEFAFSAENGSVYSSEALEDPYNPYMTLETGFLHYPSLEGVLTDTHFGARDRMGRLAGLLARIIADGLSSSPIGIGIDEATAVLVSRDGQAHVIGKGSVYVLTPASPAGQCQPGQPLRFDEIAYRKLSAGDTLSFPGASSEIMPSSLSIADGALSPVDPY